MERNPSLSSPVEELEMGRLGRVVTIVGVDKLEGLGTAGVGEMATGLRLDDFIDLFFLVEDSVGNM